MCHNCEQLQLATLRLSQDGSLKERLFDAYASHLAEVESDDLPEEMRAQFCAMCAAMHREQPMPRENPVRASVRKMSTHEVSEYAAFVVRLFAAMARTEAACLAAAARGPRLSASVMPLFAAEA